MAKVFLYRGQIAINGVLVVVKGSFALIDGCL
jgi:hypothetical protein